MNPIACKRHHLQQRLDQRDATWEQVRPAILSEDGDDLVVDVDHPAYPRQPIRNRLQPGDLIELVIRKIGYDAQTGCSCDAMRKQMNEWGWLGCWQHRGELVEWFTSKAAEVGVVVDAKSIQGLLKAAIREARFSRRVKMTRHNDAQTHN